LVPDPIHEGNVFSPLGKLADRAMYYILKSFHSRDPHILKRAYCVYVRPLLEFSSQVWSPHYKYLIDKIKSVHRYFTKRLFGFRKLSYYERLISLDLDTLKLNKQFCSTDVRKYFLAAESSMLGIVCQTML